MINQVSLARLMRLLSMAIVAYLTVGALPSNAETNVAATPAQTTGASTNNVAATTVTAPLAAAATTPTAPTPTMVTVTGAPSAPPATADNLAINRPNTLTPPPPALDVKAYVLMDVKTGQILAEKEANTRLPPASLTKMMTLYVVSDALKSGRIHLTDQVQISAKAWQMGGSKMFIRVDQLVSVQDLLLGIIVDSGNDACVALSTYTAGSEDAFVHMMNTQAQALGMKGSHFTDSTGLPDPDHYVTAHDMAILGQALIRDFPEYYGWYKQKWLTFNGIRQMNRNRLLWHDPKVDGIKTGHTDEAGYCLVASAQDGDMRLISVVLGATSDNDRATSSGSLLTYGYRFFETQKLYAANSSLTTQRVWLGEKGESNFGLAQDLYLTIPRGQYSQLQATMNIDKYLKAPIVKGKPYGTLTLTLHDQPIASVPLVALTDDPKGGLWTQMMDSLRLASHKLFHRQPAA